MLHKVLSQLNDGGVQAEGSLQGGGGEAVRERGYAVLRSKTMGVSRQNEACRSKGGEGRGKGGGKGAS